MNIDEYINWLIKKHGMLNKRKDKLPDVRPEETMEDELPERVAKTYPGRAEGWPVKGPTILPAGAKRIRKRKRRK